MAPIISEATRKPMMTGRVCTVPLSTVIKGGELNQELSGDTAIVALTGNIHQLTDDGKGRIKVFKPR